MARGYGLMGEAGPEAVLPLKRLTSGNLDVATDRRTGPWVNVQVINNADRPNSGRTSRAASIWR